MVEIKTPGTCLAEGWMRIRAAVKAAFFSAVVIGLMTHLYQFTNKLYNYDELWNTPNGYGIGAETGRWFLKIVGDFATAQFGNHSLPLVNGMISILFLAVSAALVVDMFGIKEKLPAVLIGGFMVAFPAVVCMFLFMFTAVYYSMGIFFCILAAWLVIRFPKKVLPAIAAAALLACSLGLYQAYFPAAVTLLLMHIILLCAFESGDKKWKDIILTALRYLGVLLAGLIAYMILNRVLLSVWNLEMVNYQGLDSMGKISPAELLDALKRCYQDFLALCTGNVMNLNQTHLIKIGFRCVMLIFGISGLYVLIAERGCIVKKIFFVIGCGLFPVAMFLVYLMSPNGWAYTIMGYPAVFLLVFLIIWADAFCRNIEKHRYFKVLGQWAAVLVSSVMIAVYVWYGNGCYMSLEYTKYHDLAYYETMITQIKSLDGYTDDMRVAFIGDTVTDNTNNMGSLVGGTFSIDGKIESNVSAYSKTNIITKYLGFNPGFCSYEEIIELMDNEQVKEMSCYPDAGSIKIVDGTIIVKLVEY